MILNKTLRMTNPKSKKRVLYRIIGYDNKSIIYSSLFLGKRGLLALYAILDECVTLYITKMNVELDTKLFHKRVQGLLSFWKSSLREGKEGLFAGADAIVVAVGQADEEHVYQKSTALQVINE
jgi:hypothetical protein